MYHGYKIECGCFDRIDMSLPDCYPDERMDRIYCVAPIVSGVGQEQVQYFVTAPVFTGA